ncbi:hemolysin-related protein [Chrysochromulina tobinii]|uniref:Hemolysin-related protein n=1 Tax=Chrysochromulina tobinii TaxID=1460289 RepID=A0A0M0J6N0_9EUKA|nr:hemolysin-related protein [Chrysochromulina tobinii]|eukprot:KOO22110.1 hemolysin-related protein [Chrysochromulina sp. CCMP291]
MPMCHFPALLMLPMVATFAATRVPLLELHACPRAPPMRALALSQRAPQRTPAAGGAVQQHNSRSSGLGAVALRRALRRLPSVLVGALIIPRLALASSAGGVTLSSGPLSQPQLVVRMIIWFFLFSMAALFAGAETAITTLWPWKVKQLAAEGGEDSPFAALEKDITKVLTTVLVGVTFCTIFQTALATDVAVGLFGKAGVGYATVAVTAVTLFFGEILPKSLAVAQAERFANFTLPLINVFSYLLTPLSAFTSFANDRLLSAFGVGSEDANVAVTMPELRMVLSSASQSGAVEVYEQDMIEGVLDLQRSKVDQIMTPRVELVAVAQTASLAELLELTMAKKYSRVPVYNETIDEIVGVVLSRNLLAYANDRLTGSPSGNEVQQRAGVRPLLATSVTKPEMRIMEPVGFVPESMTVMNALKQMRRQRAHMMVVVDEYGGTSGIVQEDTSSIVHDPSDGSYVIDGMADLDMVTERLNLTDQIDEELLNEFATLSGFLCHQAGEIPSEGFNVLVRRKDETAVRFTVLGGDERRILSVKATNLTLVRSEDGERTEIPSPFPPPPLQPVGLDETPLNTALAAEAPEPLVSRS